MRTHRRVRVQTMVCCALLLTLIIIPITGVTQGHVWPATGNSTQKKGGATLDTSHSSDGYVMTKYKETSKTVKVRLARGDSNYTYNQNKNGNYDVYPLQMGTGKYKTSVFEQVKGTKYATKATLSFTVNDMDETAPFLCPNQYAWYTKDSPVVAKSMELCANLNSDMEKINTVYKHITTSIVYNYPRALSIQSGSVTTYLPDLDKVYAEQAGICFDIAGLIACMLRVQGIPTKVVIGYADKTYHAWNEILVDGRYRRIDATADITGQKYDTYTNERIY